MNLKKILVTGGSGLLGCAIKALAPKLFYPSHTQLDITNLDSVMTSLDHFKPDVVLHLAADTQTQEHEENAQPGLTVNIIGTSHIALACYNLGIRIVYTSTDYIYTGPGPHHEDEYVLPPYRFAWSKLGGECAIRMLSDFLILRLSFGVVPFRWEKVYEDQLNSKLYVDEIAPLVLAAAQSDIKGVLNIGGPCTTLEAYARRSRPDIQTIPRPAWVPQDTRLDLTRMKKVLGIQDEYKLLKR